MGKLSDKDLLSFQEAVYDDYGIKLDGEKLYQAAFTLLQFIEALIKFDREDKDKKNGQKVLKLS